MELSPENKYFSKCRWISEKGARCLQRSQYVGNFCKRHCLGNYVYKPDGMEMEACSNIFSRKVRLDTIRSVETYAENKFVGRNGARYEYIESANTYVKMRCIGTNEEVVFWKDTESRGAKGGYLINTLVTVPFDDFCEDTAVCKIGEDYYCKDCFEVTFRGKIRSLVETTDMEEV